MTAKETAYWYLTTLSRCFTPIESVQRHSSSLFPPQRFCYRRFQPQSIFSLGEIQSLLIRKRLVSLDVMQRAQVVANKRLHKTAFVRWSGSWSGRSSVDRPVVHLSVRPAVRPAVHLSVRPADCPVVRPAVRPEDCPAVRTANRPAVRPVDFRWKPL